MSKNHFFTRPTKVSDITGDEEMFDDPETGWKYRAQRLQARRWRILEEKERTQYYFRNNHFSKLRHSLS